MSLHFPIPCIFSFPSNSTSQWQTGRELIFGLHCWTFHLIASLPAREHVTSESHTKGVWIFKTRSSQSGDWTIDERCVKRMVPLKGHCLLGGREWVMLVYVLKCGWSALHVSVWLWVQFSHKYTITLSHNRTNTQSH